jgi:hypothetical protein
MGKRVIILEYLAKISMNDPARGEKPTPIKRFP